MLWPSPCALTAGRTRMSPCKYLLSPVSPHCCTDRLREGAGRQLIPRSCFLPLEHGMSNRVISEIQGGFQILPLANSCSFFYQLCIKGTWPDLTVWVSAFLTMVRAFLGEQANDLQETEGKEQSQELGSSVSHSTWVELILFVPLQLWLQASLVAQTVKNLPGNAGDLGSIPGSGRSPGGGHGNPLSTLA